MSMKLVILVDFWCITSSFALLALRASFDEVLHDQLKNPTKMTSHARASQAWR